MQDSSTPLRRDERLTLALRSLYEQYGYRKFRMNRFEEYDFYAPYRDFLASGHILTFTDLDGKLMALRPDVTLSIVRKAGAGQAAERLYYTESVYRPVPDAMGFRESFQVGVEYIGQVTPYAAAELTSLAVQTLARVSPEHMLALSHTGYLEGLLSGLPVDDGLRRALRRGIGGKSAHEMAAIAGDRLPPADIERLARAARLSGPFADALPQARALAAGPLMHAALDELETLRRALAATGGDGALHLDFSISSDARYYSGLMLRGYVSGVPSAVLGGGRYDPLLRRMGKPELSAVGFALYFDELARFLGGAPDARVDTLILYPPDADPAAVAVAVQAQAARGGRVWAGTAPPEGLTWDKVLEVK